MREATRNIIVGLTAIAGLVVLGYLILAYGDAPGWITPNYPLVIHFKDASGIATGTRVKLNGIDIGFVTEVTLKEPSYLGVTVNCAIYEEFDIPTSAVPTSKAGLLGGAAQLNLKTFAPPEGVQETFLPRDGTAKLDGKTSDLADEFTSAIGRLESQIDPILRNVRELLEPLDLAKVDSGQIPGNLRTAIQRLDSRLAELQESIASFNALVDEATRNQVKGVISDTRETIGVLKERFVQISDDLSRSLASINEILADIKKGEGTAGKLLKDPKLYDSLTDASDRISDALNELILLIKKWKAEGLPIQF